MSLKKHTFSCPVGKSLDIFAGRWKPEILFYLYEGPVRFNKLLKTIGNISQKMLTQQLRALERDGLVIRNHYPEIPPRVEYEATALGMSLEPLFAEIAAWGETNKAEIELSQKKYDSLNVKD